MYSLYLRVIVTKCREAANPIAMFQNEVDGPPGRQVNISSMWLGAACGLALREGVYLLFSKFTTFARVKGQNILPQIYRRASQIEDFPHDMGNEKM